MKTLDLNKPITAHQLNENMFKKFGVKVNFDKYTREELENYRNLLRTKIFQVEQSRGFNANLTDDTYHKDKAMVNLLNTKIKEMLGESKKAKPDFLDLDKDGNKTEPMKKAAKDAKMEEGWDDMMKAVKDKESEKGTGKFDKKKTSTGTQYTRKSSTYDNGTEDKPKDKKVKEGKACSNGHTKMTKGCDECAGMWESTGDYSAKKARDGKDIGKPGKGFEKIAKSAGKRYGSKAAGERVAGAVLAKLRKESVNNFRHNVKFVNESLSYLLAEDEEGKAKAITAASDIVNDYTSWMQRVGQYQTKAIIELADAIKADFGAAEAETFKQSVAPALASTLETLTSQREAISNAVAVLAGEAAPTEPMGMEPPEDTGMDMAPPDEMNPEPAGDEFGASDAAAGGDEVSGREMRESREQRRARRLAESHSIISKLAK